MADRPPVKSSTSPDPTSKKETADQRRERQKAAVVATQIDLKREAAERRAAKLKS
jgi:hypothetical protein